MILEAIFDFGIWLFNFISESLPSAQPTLYAIADGFWDIASFGIWVIGEDMWVFFISTITAWLTFKMIWGSVLFIYRLIPLV